MRKRLLGEDIAMALQWAAIIVYAPFVFIPINRPQEISYGIRIAVVFGLLAFSAVMTILYLLAKRQSLARARYVVNFTAAVDLAFVTLFLILWPRFMPGLFFVYPLVMITVAMRFPWKVTIGATAGIAALYSVTLVTVWTEGYSGAVLADTLLKVLVLFIVAGMVAYLSFRGRRSRKETLALSEASKKLAQCRHPQEVFEALLGGIKMVSGIGRSTMYLIGANGHWARPRALTSDDPAVRKLFLDRPIDLNRQSVASVVAEKQEPLLIEDASGHPLVDQRWAEDLNIGPLLCLPMVQRGETKGLIFVEPSDPRRLFYQKEVGLFISMISQAVTVLENVELYEREKRKRAELGLIHRAALEMISSLAPRDVLRQACRYALEAVGGKSAIAFYAEGEKGELVPQVKVNTSGEELPFSSGGIIRSRDVESMFRPAGDSPVISLDDPRKKQPLPLSLREPGAVLLAPIRDESKVIGLLYVEGGTDRSFGEGDEGLLAAIAGEASLTMSKARLHQRIVGEANQLASIVQLIDAIGSTPKLENVLRASLDMVAKVFDCTSALIYRVDPETGYLVLADAFGYSPRVIERLLNPPFTACLDCRTVTLDRLVAVSDISRARGACHSLKVAGEGSAVCVAMKFEGSTLGVLHIRSDKPHSFTDSDCVLARAVAHQVAMALQRAYLFDEISRLAITDSLTGVYNLRYLRKTLSEEVSRASRYDRPFSLIMVDVDNLKSHNDALGHQEGDRVLSRVARVLDENTREVDKVFRYGGDEFCVVLPETDIGDAMIVAEKARRRVEAFHASNDTGAPRMPVTISVGVAAYPLHAGSAEVLISAADSALYIAKKRGRNFVAAANA